MSTPRSLRDFAGKSHSHGGVSGRYRAWRDRAFTQAWMLDRLGLADVDPSL